MTKVKFVDNNICFLGDSPYCEYFFFVGCPFPYLIPFPAVCIIHLMRVNSFGPVNVSGCCFNISSARVRLTYFEALAMSSRDRSEAWLISIAA